MSPSREPDFSSLPVFPQAGLTDSSPVQASLALEIRHRNSSPHSRWETTLLFQDQGELRLCLLTPAHFKAVKYLCQLSRVSKSSHSANGELDSHISAQNTQPDTHHQRGPSNTQTASLDLRKMRPNPGRSCMDLLLTARAEPSESVRSRGNLGAHEHKCGAQHSNNGRVLSEDAVGQGSEISRNCILGNE
ncbi:lactadherin-like [Platysternon megacephalum]|uniref:Lactadherin-like n=1 Tax=Platysternon megacephalum TaxID=55544 RepID=A0A4D9DK73_9SAUR|nr:lactadherin-like [Platysternon megacephalum]